MPRMPMAKIKPMELDLHIVAAERRIAQQRAQIESSAALGRDTEGANKLLGQVQRHLDALNKRRREALAEQAGPAES